jgi:hypothetical protein
MECKRPGMPGNEKRKTILTFTLKKRMNHCRYMILRDQIEMQIFGSLGFSDQLTLTSFGHHFFQSGHWSYETGYGS